CPYCRGNISSAFFVSLQKAIADLQSSQVKINAVKNLKIWHSVLEKNKNVRRIIKREQYIFSHHMFSFVELFNIYYSRSKDEKQSPKLEDLINQWSLEIIFQNRDITCVFDCKDIDEKRIKDITTV